MRSPEEIDAFYEEVLLPPLHAFDAQRRQRDEALRRWLRSARPLLVGSLLAVALALFTSGLLLLAWLAFAAWRLRALPGRPGRLPWDALRQDLVGRVVAFCQPGLHHEAHGRIAEPELRRSGLFRESFDLSTGEDLVAGRVGATAVRFSEIRLLRRRRKQPPETVFRGVLFVADAPKAFSGRVLLLPDRAEALLGGVGRALQRFPIFAGATLIELEDPEFERHFACWATDPTEARYLLSPSLIRRLLRFRQNTGSALRAAFVDDSLYLAIPLDRDLFADAGSLDTAVYRRWAGELGFLAGIVEDLDLDTRVWSKPAPEAPLRRAPARSPGA